MRGLLAALCLVSLGARAQVLKLAHVQPETHAFHKGAVRFAEELKKVSGGKLTVQIFSNGVMGNERDLLEALQIGSMDLVTVTSALTGKFAPAYQVFSLPFLFGSYADAFRATDDKSVTDAMEKKLIGKGIRPIAYWAGGARSYYGTSAIASVADFKGKKVRTLEDPWYVRTWEALGALPSPLPFGQVYTAMQSKLVDGAEGAIDTYVSKKFYEVAPDVAMINSVYSVQLLHISEQRWQSLSPQERQWVEAAAKASSESERALVVQQDKDLEKTLAEHQVKITRPDLAPFHEAVKPVYDRFKRELGPESWSVVEKLRKH